ncbi:uncharacterized protein EHS24_006173 [Apiotrichum porosum]|uniref:Uncharacterized protein n=1 Tax=Apiotrichum porosum TaxID=105984 RepID=A0A427Y0M5_9TREE|nr:uncharacterized protein EHS24_006173 [Apiotrichum porosum]RSH84649.1 hypothetical protein EHS24_006173 [Apiotrichum porosum]
MSYTVANQLPAAVTFTHNNEEFMELFNKIGAVSVAIHEATNTIYTARSGTHHFAWSREWRLLELNESALGLGLNPDCDLARHILDVELGHGSWQTWRDSAMTYLSTVPALTFRTSPGVIAEVMASLCDALDLAEVIGEKVDDAFIDMRGSGC